MCDLKSCVVRDKSSRGFGRHSSPEERKALFHCFSDSWIYADDRQIPRTKAIVEYEDGSVAEVDPDAIKFTK